jgi:hypothetical protein
MNKPSGYDDVQVGGGFTPVDLGGHYCQIKQVAERKSSTGKDMIVVVFDFVKPDAQEGYFMEQFKNDVREDKKWPFAGSKYIMVNDYQEPSKTSRQFKSFCTCVENSNSYQIQWGGNDWAAQFKGKKIGAVYGEEEHEYDGKVSKRRLVRYFCSLDAVKDAKIPEAKLLKNVNRPAANDTSFVNIPEGTEEEIPF